MKIKISKWGNSAAIRLPKSILNLVGLKEGSEAELLVENDAIIIRPQKIKKYNLDELLSQINSSNLHKEVSTGSATGKEIW